jgi:hypothetical protein
VFGKLGPGTLVQKVFHPPSSDLEKIEVILSPGQAVMAVNSHVHQVFRIMYLLLNEALVSFSPGLETAVSIGARDGEIPSYSQQ